MIIYADKETKDDIKNWIEYLRVSKQCDNYEYLKNVIINYSMPGSNNLWIARDPRTTVHLLLKELLPFRKDDVDLRYRPIEVEAALDFNFVAFGDLWDFDGNQFIPRNGKEIYDMKENHGIFVMNGGLINHCMNNETGKYEHWNSSLGMHT